MTDGWQTQMIAMIRGVEPLDGGLFAGGALSPVEQIGVYREQYRLRMWDAVVEEIPGLMHLLGDGAGDVIWPFLDDHPPSSWSLQHIVDPLADWLAARGAPIEQIEMARLDRAVMRGFLAAAGRTPTPADLARVQSGALRLRLQPAVTLLRSTRSVHRLRTAVLGEGEVPALEAGDFPLAVFRVDRLMRHLELEPGAYALLDAIARGRTLEESLGDALAAVGDADQLGRSVGGWFQRFVERGLIEIDDS